MKKLIIFIFILMFSTKIAYSESLDPIYHSSTITEVEVTGNLQIGDTIQLGASFTPNISTTFTVGLDFSEAIQPLGFSGDSLTLNEVVELDSGVNYNRSYDLIIKDEGFSILDFNLKPNISTNNDFSSLESGPPYGINITPQGGNLVILDEVDDLINAYAEDLNPPWGISQSNPHSVIIDGKITYIDKFNEQQSKEKGAFTTAWLWFRDLDGDEPNTTLYHPVPLSNGEHIEGTHFAKCDKDGKYHFEFGFNKDISNENLEIWIFTQKGNEAIELYSHSEHNSVNLVQQTEHLRTFFKIDTIGFNTSSYTHHYHFYDSPDSDGDNHTIPLKYYDGNPLRFCYLTKLFVKERYGVNSFADLPFNDQLSGDKLPKIDFHVLTIDRPNKSAWYHNNNPVKEIFCESWHTKAGVIFHEYGHYVDDCLNDLKGLINGWGSEAFAMFFNTAVSSWSNNLQNGYDEPFIFAGNCEMAPYYYATLNRQPDGYTNERFSNLGYWNYSASGLKACKYASYLWNLYDSREEGNFMPYQILSVGWSEIIGGENNDDVELGKYVFEMWNEYPNLPHDEFHDKILDDIQDTELNTSIQYIYDFMDFDDNSVFPDMRSAQIIPQGQSCDCNGFICTWKSGSYTNGSRDLVVVQDVLTATCNMRNFETNYKYNQTLISTSINQAVHWDKCNCPPGSDPDQYYYTITANNSSGDSYDPWIIAYPSMEKQIREVAKIPQENDNLKIYPNPFHNFLNLLIISETATNSIIDISDLSGKYLKTFNYDLIKGKNVVNLDLSDLNTGVYLIKIIFEDKIVLKKIIKN